MDSTLPLLPYVFVACPLVLPIRVLNFFGFVLTADGAVDLGGEDRSGVGVFGKAGGGVPGGEDLGEDGVHGGCSFHM